MRRPGWGLRDTDPKPAIQTSTDSGACAASETAPPWPPPPARSPQASAREPYREAIEQALARSQVRDAFQLRLNAYRVLMTRGRDATVVFVPPRIEWHRVIRRAKMGMVNFSTIPRISH